MKLLVFGDVHGNLSSLQSLIETNDFKSADKVIFLGDVMMGASRPNECIELIDNIKCECVVGNNDAYVFDSIPKCEIEEFSKQKALQLEYMKKIVTDKNKSIMKNWKRELYLTIEGKKFYFVHYPWEIIDDEYSVIDIKDKNDLMLRKEMFKDIDADYVFFAHEHESSYFKCENKECYGVNSLGSNKIGKYLVVDFNNQKIKVEERTLLFDVSEELKLMKKAGYPYNRKKFKY